MKKISPRFWLFQKLTQLRSKHGLRVIFCSFFHLVFFRGLIYMSLKYWWKCQHKNASFHCQHKKDKIENKSFKSYELQEEVENQLRLLIQKNHSIVQNAYYSYIFRSSNTNRHCFRTTERFARNMKKYPQIFKLLESCHFLSTTFILGYSFCWRSILQSMFTSFFLLSVTACVMCV